MCVWLTKSLYIHLGLSETHLNSCIGEESLSIPNYTIFQHDVAHCGQTAMGLFVHKSIAHITKRRADLESERVDCMWVEVKHSSSNATLVGYIWRERERERERETERQTERDRDRDRDRQTDRQAGRQTDRQTDRETEREILLWRMLGLITL